MPAGPVVQDRIEPYADAVNAGVRVGAEAYLQSQRLRVLLQSRLQEITAAGEETRAPRSDRAVRS